MRSPNPWNANNVRNVNTDGSLNNNNAYNGNGAVADCEKCQLKVSSKIHAAEIRTLTQGVLDLPRLKGGTHTSDAVSLRTVTAINAGSFYGQ